MRGKGVNFFSPSVIKSGLFAAKRRSIKPELTLIKKNTYICNEKQNTHNYIVGR